MTHVGGKASLIIAFFTLVSQVLALFRDVLLARTVGVGPTLDLYFSAFRVPDMLYVILSSFVAATVLVPLLYEKEKEGGDVERRFVESILYTLLVVGVVLVSLVWLLVPVFAQALIPSGGSIDASQYISVTRLLLLSPLLLTISAFFGSINQKTHTYFSFAISPVVYNLGIIFGITVLYPYIGIHGLIAGVLFGCALHVLVQFLGAHRHIGGIYSAKPRIVFKDIMKLARFALPRSAALFFAQMQMFVLVGSIAYVGTGAVSAFFFAYNLQSVFLSLIGASISVTAFSTLTKAYADQNFEGYHVSLAKGIRTIVFLSLPVSVLGIFLSSELSHLVFGFTKHREVGMASSVPTLFGVAILSIGAQSLALLLARAHYAAKNSRIPLIAQILPTLMFVCVYVYTRYVSVAQNVSFIYIVMAVFSVAAFIQCTLLYLTLPSHSVRKSVLDEEVTKIAVAGMAGILIIFLVNIGISKTFILSSFFAILAKSIGITISFLIPYYIVLKKLRSEELSQIEHTIRAKFTHYTR